MIKMCTDIERNFYTKERVALVKLAETLVFLYSGY